MPLDGKPLNELAEADLQELVLNQVREWKTIEYKRSLPGPTYDDKKEFLADASSFANTHGGYLLYGVQAKDGIAEELLGIDDSEIDAAIARLESMMRDGVKPGLTGVQVHPIRLESGKTVLVLRIGRSWALPHRVTLNGHDKFYGRGTAGKYPLDVPELRALFNLSENLAERVRAFRGERLSKVMSGDMPLPLMSGPRTVLHIAPLGAFLPGRQHLAVTQKGLNLECPVIRTMETSHRINFDGLLTFFSYSTDRGLVYDAYTQLFRNGVVEAVDADMIGAQVDKLIPITFFEVKLIEAVVKYIRLLLKIGADTPFVIMLSLLGVKEYRMGSNVVFGQPIDRDNLILPEILVESANFEAPEVMKPAFDAIWNAIGHAGSSSYDSQGKWVGKSIT